MCRCVFECVSVLRQEMCSHLSLLFMYFDRQSHLGKSSRVLQQFTSVVTNRSVFLYDVTVVQFVFDITSALSVDSGLLFSCLEVVPPVPKV